MEVIQALGMVAAIAWLLWVRRDLAYSLRDLSTGDDTAKLIEEPPRRPHHPFIKSERGRPHVPHASA